MPDTPESDSLRLKPDPFRIEPGFPADLDRVMALAAAVIVNLRSQGIDQWDEIYPDRAVIANDLAAGTLSVAEAGGRLAGMIVLNEHQEPQYQSVDWRFSSGRCLVVHRLCVHPEVEGRGAAKALMAFAETTARGRGCGALRLDAFTGNPRALALYERLGYRKAGEVTFRKGRFACFEKALLELSSSVHSQKNHQSYSRRDPICREILAAASVTCSATAAGFRDRAILADQEALTAAMMWSR